MILVDTSYLIALLDHSDEHHLRALRWSRVLFQRLLVTEYVLLEAVNHFSAPVNRARAWRLLDYMQSETQAEVVFSSSVLFNAGLLLHRSRPDKGWSLTDCISFHVARERGLSQALTHDHHFVQAGFDALLRRDP